MYTTIYMSVYENIKISFTVFPQQIWCGTFSTVAQSRQSWLTQCSTLWVANSVPCYIIKPRYTKEWSKLWFIKTPTVSLRSNSYCFNCHPSMYCFIRTQVLLFTCNETEVGSLLRCIIVHWDAIPTVSLWPHCASNTFWCCGRALCQHTMYFWEWANQRNTCSPVTTYMRSTICICICISERGLIKGTLVLWW